MTIRITTTRAVAALVLALAYVALAPATPAAADREHQQIMADLRILQEQTQQLQALMTDLGEALKAVNSRIEDQTSLERKAFADGKVQMDTMSGDLRVVREKVDETNVRLGTITQELESIRQAIPEPGRFRRRPSTPMPTQFPARTPGGSAPPPTTATTPPPNPGVQPQRLFDSSYGDYTAGNYSLAIAGIRKLPARRSRRARSAHEAQLYIGESLAWQKKDMEAVAAYDRVIANYPGSASVPHGVLQARAWPSSGWEKPRARASRTKRCIKQFPDSHSRRSSPSSGSNG